MTPLHAFCIRSDCFGVGSCVLRFRRSSLLTDKKDRFARLCLHCSSKAFQGSPQCRGTGAYHMDQLHCHHVAAELLHSIQDVPIIRRRGCRLEGIGITGNELVSFRSCEGQCHACVRYGNGAGQWDGLLISPALTAVFTDHAGGCVSQPGSLDLYDQGEVICRVSGCLNGSLSSSLVVCF